MKWNSAISRGLPICRRVEIKDCVSGCHGFNQRWVNASNLTRKDEYTRILLEAPIRISINGPCENDAPIGKRFELANINRLVRIAAHNNQWPVRPQIPKGAKHEFRVVFRFEPCDVEDVPLAGQSEAGKMVARVGRL